MKPCDLIKTRTIRFHPLPPQQALQAAALLARIFRIAVSTPLSGLEIVVRYSLEHHTLAKLECWLIEQQFHLDNSLLSKMKRALIYYCEQVQQDNLALPERLTKKPKEIYINAWQRHLHGDHDETPVEWRQYR